MNTFPEIRSFRLFIELHGLALLTEDSTERVLALSQRVDEETNRRTLTVAMVFALETVRVFGMLVEDDYPGFTDTWLAAMGQQLMKSELEMEAG